MAKTTIHSDYIPDNAITSTKIAENSIGAREIATNAITTLYVADGSVTTVKIADDAITSAKLGSALTLGGNTTFNDDITLSNDKDIHFLTNSGSNDGTMITRATGDALRIKYATNVLIFDSVDNLATRFYNSNGVAALEILPNATAADSQVKVNNGNFIVNSGNVGIGTTSPLEKLDVRDYTGIAINSNYCHVGSTVSGAMAIFGHNIKSDSANNTIKSANTGYHSSMIKMYYNEGITFHATSGTATAGDTFYDISGTTNELMRITNSGNVGIGTSSPSRKFHVVDSANNDVATFINNDATNGYGLNINGGGTASGRYSLRVANQANTVVLQANADGNVGINTSSPDENLTISSTAPTIKLIDSDGTQQNTIIKQSGGNFFVLARDNTNNAGIVFAGNGGDSFSEYARFDSSGNFGIGTSSPQKTLDVTGTFAISNNTSNYWDFDRDDTDGSLKIADTGTERMRINSSGQVLVNPLGVSTPSFAFTNDTNTGMTRPTGDTLQLITAGAQRLRINANGRIGIGTNGGNSGLHVANGDIRCTAAAVANDANSISMSQESAGGVITARGPSTATRGKIYLSVNKSNGSDSLAGFLLDNNGRIGMGDTSYTNQSSPNYQVHICGDGTSLCIESGTGEAYIGSQNTSYFHFLGNRAFYFGNASYANGGFHTYSDERLKENIIKIDSALDKVSQMKGVTFNWKDKELRGDGKQFGIIAQDMLKVDKELPNLTEHAEATQEEIDDKNVETQYYSMDYSRITPFLIEAVKELKTKLEAAEARITELEG